MHGNTQRIFSASFFSIKVFVAFFVLHRFLYRYFLFVPIFCCFSSRPFLWSVLSYSFSQTLLLSRKLLYIFLKLCLSLFSFFLTHSSSLYSHLESSNVYQYKVITKYYTNKFYVSKSKVFLRRSNKESSILKLFDLFYSSRFSPSISLWWWYITKCYSCYVYISFG